MLTLSEVSQRTGISMPTLQRYKKIYQSRIPAEGKGRKQRYPESALPVFEELKVENAGRRGRPRKNASAPANAGNGGNAGNAGRTGSTRRGRKPGKAAPAAAAAPVKRGPGRPRKNAAPAAAKAARKSAAAPARGGRKAASGARGARGRRGSGSGLLTLGQVSEQTGISYPTLVRYVRVHSDRLPSEGTGRSRRFHPEAVGVFRELRQESGRGGRKPNAANAGKTAKSAKSAKTAKAAKTVGRGRGPGRPAATPAAAESGLTQRLRSLERTQQDLEKRFRGFVQSLQKLFK